MGYYEDWKDKLSHEQISDDRYNNDSQELELVWFAVRLKLEAYYGIKSSVIEDYNKLPKEDK